MSIESCALIAQIKKSQEEITPENKKHLRNIDQDLNDEQQPKRINENPDIVNSF